jgi:hypothetical protein
LFSNIAPVVPPVLLFAIVYHIECATYYNTKNLKESRNRDIKKALLGAGLGFSRFDFVWLFANF